MNSNAIKNFLAACILCSIYACGGNQTSETLPATDTSALAEQPSAEQQSVARVVDGYLQLKDALVNSNATLAQEKAVQLLEAIDATQMPGIQLNTKQIAATQDLEKQRVHFDSVSIYLYKNIKEIKGHQQTLYKQQCPMAFNNRGAFWLSNSEEIKNPYYGQQMLSCGKVEEVIETEN